MNLPSREIFFGALLIFYFSLSSSLSCILLSFPSLANLLNQLFFDHMLVLQVNDLFFFYEFKVFRNYFILKSTTFLLAFSWNLMDIYLSCLLLSIFILWVSIIIFLFIVILYLLPYMFIGNAPRRGLYLVSFLYLSITYTRKIIIPFPCDLVSGILPMKGEWWIAGAD